MRQRTCERCGESFQKTRRDPSVWCVQCRRATENNELAALVFVDGSGIMGLFETSRAAFEALREDFQTTGQVRCNLVKVLGHAGAVALVERWDDQDEADRRFANAQFERDVL